jgi:maltooligosyltrehalose trehalohydrolase
MLGTYFSSTYHNPWGDAINFDGKGSDEVRAFILQNVQYWIREYRMDGLRLDAIHSIYDGSPRHILTEINHMIRRLETEMGREVKIIAETDRNDPGTVREPDKCGYGFNGQWNDDFHHALHCFLSGERSGYYMDYGAFDQIVHAYTHGYVYDGVYSKFLGKTRGAQFTGVPFERLVVFSQNHDQVGNRAFGERPIAIMGERKALLFAVAVIASPFTPMLFMGEEFGASNPFLFFMESGDKEFARKVFQGRKDEFSGFGWGDDIPDPADMETFFVSKLDHERSGDKVGRRFLGVYKNIIRIRKKYIMGFKPDVISDRTRSIIILYYRETGIRVIMSFSSRDQNIIMDNEGLVLLDTEDSTVTESDSEKKVNRGEFTIQPFSALIVKSVH